MGVKSRPNCLIGKLDRGFIKRRAENIPLGKIAAITSEMIRSPTGSRRAAPTVRRDRQIPCKRKPVSHGERQYCRAMPPQRHYR
jgi:hypothetical protein